MAEDRPSSLRGSFASRVLSSGCSAFFGCRPSNRGTTGENSVESEMVLASMLCSCSPKRRLEKYVPTPDAQVFQPAMLRSAASVEGFLLGVWQSAEALSMENCQTVSFDSCCRAQVRLQDPGFTTCTLGQGASSERVLSSRCVFLVCITSTSSADAPVPRTAEILCSTEKFQNHSVTFLTVLLENSSFVPSELSYVDTCSVDGSIFLFSFLKNVHSSSASKRRLTLLPSATQSCSWASISPVRPTDWRQFRRAASVALTVLSTITYLSS
mmetsp:Transcript_5118/g.18978  ORF Transcript_5118/g.18978 Transcript_5118/m.18978 type:complete len:269 (-) Transcript_5118:130-936(-)